MTEFDEKYEFDGGPSNSQDLKILKNAHLGAGFAHKGELAEYLRCGSRNVCALVDENHLKPNRAGKFDWSDVWWRLWRIRNVPAAMFENMKQPLLKNSDVAKLLGVHERSIRRDGDRQQRRYELPDHLDLSVRIRRHHPIRLELWSTDEIFPLWLRAAPSSRGLNLVSKRHPSLERMSPTADIPAINGKFD